MISVKSIYYKIYINIQIYWTVIDFQKLKGNLFHYCFIYERNVASLSIYNNSIELRGLLLELKQTTILIV